MLRALWPGNINEQIQKWNAAIDLDNNKRTRKAPHVSLNEFYTFLGILLVAHIEGHGGTQLWNKDEPKPGVHTVHKGSGVDLPMSQSRFEILKRTFSSINADPAQEHTNEWWQFVAGVDAFNKNRKRAVAAGNDKVFDESMSAWCHQSTKAGGLPNLSFIMRKPEPLGTEFKVVCCSVTGMALWIKIQAGKVLMKDSQYQKEHGATNACVIRGIEQTTGCGQRVPQDTTTNVTRDKFFGDSWFASVRSAEECYVRGVDFVGPVKTATRLFPIKELQDILEKWPGGTSIVLEGQGPKETPLLAIGYKYNSRKCLTFVATRDSGSTENGKPYLARFNDEHQNVKLRAVERPAILSEYFQSSNAVDAHNQSRQATLKLEKHWVTQNPYFRLSCSLFGMVVVDAWKGLRHGLAGNHPDKRMGLSDFVRRMCWDLLYNQGSQNRAAPASDLSPIAPTNQQPAPAAARASVPTHVLFGGSATSGGAGGSTVSALTPPATVVRAATRAHNGTREHIQKKEKKRRRCGVLHVDPADPNKKRKCGALTYIRCVTCNMVPCCNPHSTDRNCWEVHTME